MQLFSILVFLALLPLVVAGVRVAAARWGWVPEIRRKVVHMAMGLAVLAFPWVFDSVVPVAVLCGLSLAVLGWIRYREGREGFRGVAVLHAVGRASLGDVLFPLAVVAVFWLSLRHEGGVARVLYLVPILILTVADAAGALVGTRYGVKTFASLSGWKSAEGCLTFFISAFLGAHIPLLLMTDTGRAESLLIACILALVVMMFEAISTRGLDNLIVPLAAALLLERFIDLDIAALAWRLVGAAGLFGLVFCLRRGSSLDGGALLGAVLFGYGCWALGGWRFVIPPMILFGEHLWITRKLRGSGLRRGGGRMVGKFSAFGGEPPSHDRACGLEGAAGTRASPSPFKPTCLKSTIAAQGSANLRHDLLPVLSVGLALLPWPALAAWRPEMADAALAAFVCGTAAHLAMFNVATRVFVTNRRATARMKNRASLKAAVVIGVAGWLLVTHQPWLVMVGVMLVLLILRTVVELFARFARDPSEGDHHPARWVRQGVLALLAGVVMFYCIVWTAWY